MLFQHNTDNLKKATTRPNNKSLVVTRNCFPFDKLKIFQITTLLLDKDNNTKKTQLTNFVLVCHFYTSMSWILGFLPYLIRKKILSRRRHWSKSLSQQWTGLTWRSHLCVHVKGLREVCSSMFVIHLTTTNVSLL